MEAGNAQDQNPQSGSNSPSAAELDVRSRIVDLARRLFMSHGFTKVTMEEIAQELGISKKTLYKHFSNKEEVLRGVAQSIMAEGESRLGSVLSDSNLTFPAKLDQLMVAVGIQSSRVAPQILKDIRLNAPTVWPEIYAFRQRRIKAFSELIREGIHQGYLRSDLDEEMVITIFLGAVEKVMDPERISEGDYTPQHGLRTIVTVLFDGLLTDRGRSEYRNTM